MAGPGIHIKIVAVGRIKGASVYLQTGIDEYAKRLAPYARLEVVDVADEPGTASRTAEQVLQAEGERILKYLQPAHAAVVALSEHGKQYDSPGFSQFLLGNQPNGGIADGGSTPIIFVVGGASGLSREVVESSQAVVSLSPMTFPHQMVRLILLEQLYRAFKIQRGEPYHK